MALPLVGFAWLLTALASLFASALAIFSRQLLNRLVIIAAVTAALVTVVTLFIISIKALLSGLVVPLPAAATVGFSLVVPSNFAGCVSVIMSAHILRFVYEWKTRVIQYRLF